MCAKLQEHEESHQQTPQVEVNTYSSTLMNLSLHFIIVTPAVLCLCTCTLSFTDYVLPFPERFVGIALGINYYSYTLILKILIPCKSYLHLQFLTLKMPIFIHFSIHIWEVAKLSAWTLERELTGKHYYGSNRIFLCKNKAKLRICKTCGISKSQTVQFKTLGLLKLIPLQI